MKKIFGLLILCTLSLNLQAQSSKGKVREMIKAMQADKMIDQMMAKMVPMMVQQAKAKLDTPEKMEKFEVAQTIIMEEAKTFTKELLNGTMVDIYAKYFNNDDIDNLIKFYKTETGIKLIELTPTITAELMQKMMQNELPKFQQKIKSRLDSLEK